MGVLTSGAIDGPQVTMPGRYDMELSLGSVRP